MSDKRGNQVKDYVDDDTELFSITIIRSRTSLSAVINGWSVSLGWWKGRGWNLWQYWNERKGNMHDWGFKFLLLTVQKLRFWNEENGWWE